MRINSSLVGTKVAYSNKLSKTNKWFLNNWGYCIIGFIIIILPVWIFILTRPAKWEEFDLSNTGQIGDTIGGLTAPIFNLLTAILLYISFRAQKKANDQQRESLEKEIKRTNESKEISFIMDLINQIYKEVDSLVYTTYFTPNPFTIYLQKDNTAIEEKHYGVDAVRCFCNNYRITDYSEKEMFLIDCNYILSIANTILDKISTSELDKEDKGFLSLKIRLFYTSKLYPSFKDLFSNLIAMEEALEQVQEEEIKFKKSYTKINDHFRLVNLISKD